MIYITRHGQTEWNLQRKLQGQADVPLNETGRNEAIICAKQLSSIKFDEIVASDLPRAEETADIINKLTSCPIRFDARLREHNCGDIQGQIVSGALLHSYIHEPDRFHAEPFTDFYNRLKSFFNEIDATKNTLIVTHTGVVKMIMHMVQHPDSYDQDDFEKTVSQFKVKNGDIFTWDKKHHPQLLIRDPLTRSNSLEY